jgi:hypothetical protein
MQHFYFGRIDVRFGSLPTLLRFESFRIIEINGTGSEPTHIWDPTRSLWDAWCARFSSTEQHFESVQKTGHVVFAHQASARCIGFGGTRSD